MNRPALRVAQALCRVVAASAVGEFTSGRCSSSVRNASYLRASLVRSPRSNASPLFVQHSSTLAATGRRGVEELACIGLLLGTAIAADSVADKTGVTLGHR